MTKIFFQTIDIDLEVEPELRWPATPEARQLADFFLRDLKVQRPPA